jgi:nucleoside-diphosphate-sugar epimerase
MRRLKSLCLEHKLDLIEDCAECYTGLGDTCYKGSIHADVTLFSFGFIKTATALGGGIILANQPELISDMNRKQFSIYKDQSSIEYIRLLITAFLIRCLCDVPLLYGFLYFCVSLIGLDFDRVVRRSVQGFPSIPCNQQSTEFDVMMKKIRRRPSCTLISVLCCRFQSSMEELPSVKWRIEQCTSFRAKLQHSSVVKFADDATPTHWIFPIKVDESKLLCSYARRYGYDITQGSSQLICTGGDDDCPKTCALLSRVAYLPLASRKLSSSSLSHLKALINSNPTNLRDTEDERTSFAIATRRMSILVGVLAAIWWVSIKSAATLLIQTIFAVGVLVGVLLTSFYWVQMSMSSFYLRTSNAFVKHLDVFQSESNSKLQPGIDLARPDDSVEDMFTSHRVLKLPGETCQYKGAIVLTGSTGFIGRAILRDLLFHRRKLGITRVWLICRPKRGKSSYQRIADLLDDKMFSFLTKQEKDEIIVTVEGDVTLEDAGIEKGVLDGLLADKTITHLIHCAAAVSFTQSMEDAARANITSSLIMQQLSGRLSGQCVRFVHISTAFVHGGESGTPQNPLDESLFPLGSFGAKEIYKSMCGTQFYAASAMRSLQFPNTYTFSKCVCEHLLMESSVPTIIIRPSIVGPALRFPFEGWAGKSPSTLVAAASLYFFYQWNLWNFGPHTVPCIPVDVLSRFVINKAFSQGSRPFVDDESPSSDDDFERICAPEVSSMTTESDKAAMSESNQVHVYNAAWDFSSDAHTQFTWVEYAVAVTQFGAVMGDFSRLVAKIGLMFTTRLLPALGLTLPQYEKLHWFLVVCPFKFLLWLAQFSGRMTYGMKQLQSFLDLPLLFFPFMTKEYYFKSNLVAPESLQGDRYLFLCTIAAHKFVHRTSQTEKTSNGAYHTLAAYPFAGRLYSPTTTDSVWALSQPVGSLGIRFLAWAVVKILGLIFEEVTVNVESFALVLKNYDGNAQVVLAPTHRSFCDFVLMSLLLFSIPELQIDIPHIAAAAEFAELPLISWIVKIGQAIFIRRNQGSKDPALGRSIRLVLQNDTSPVFEVFLEGGRSRDRRFVKPRTGFLKCLQEEYKGDLLVIPITISYERVPEQSNLSREASSFRSVPMTLQAFLSWIMVSL